MPDIKKKNDGNQVTRKGGRLYEKAPASPRRDGSSKVPSTYSRIQTTSSEEPPNKPSEK